MSGFSHSMNKTFICFFLMAVLPSFCVQVLGVPSSYRAAVVEYHPERNPNELERIQANVFNFKKFMEEAKKKGAEIIVFPENGLLIKSDVSYIPDPAEHIAPCDSNIKEISQAVKDLSCASRKYLIYTVINVLEKRQCLDGDENCSAKDSYIFNSNVVFDRAGVVVAKYAKYNLYDEFLTNKTKYPEMVFFDTDFGVRFGTFTCFDIMFKAPTLRLIQQYHITNFVFPTFWFGELPFLTALQTQKGWAEANNVNLLASGVNEPSTGSGGSGIYNGKFGELVQIMPDIATSKLLIADVPLNQESSCLHGYQKKNFSFSQVVNSSYLSVPSRVTDLKFSEASSQEFLKDKLDNYTSVVLEEGNEFHQTLCSGSDFCCNFEVKMNALHKISKNYTCRAMVFNGVRNFGIKFRGGVQVCGIVICSGPHIRNCTNRIENVSELFEFKKILIKGNFKNRNSFQMPSTLVSEKELKPLSADKYEFRKQENSNNVEVSLELLWPVVDLYSFAIWGRDFTRDNEPPLGSSTSLTRSIPVLLLSFVSFLLVNY